jgi:uncharacterized protein YaaR (DUF327 family)
LDGIFSALNPLLTEVQRGGVGKPAAGKTGKSAARGKTRETDKSFAAMLEKTAERVETPAASEDALVRLMDGVHEAGDALRDKPFLDELLRYKSAVRLFMSYVVENSFDLQVGEGLPASQKAGFKGLRGSPESKERKSFPQVKVVDEKLERLAAGIMTGQLKELELLAGIEEINGLLVDMLE